MCICACVCVCVYKHIFSHRKPSNRNGFMIHVYCTCNKLLDSLYHNVVCIAIARAIDMVWYGQMESISSILNEWWCVHNEREKHKKKRKKWKRMRSESSRKHIQYSLYFLQKMLLEAVCYFRFLSFSLSLETLRLILNLGWESVNLYLFLCPFQVLDIVV